MDALRMVRKVSFTFVGLVLCALFQNCGGFSSSLSATLPGATLPGSATPATMPTSSTQVTSVPISVATGSSTLLPTATPVPLNPSPIAISTPTPTPLPGAGGAVSCDGSNGLALCDDFESAIGGMPDASVWSVSTPDCSGSGKVAIDTSQAHSGHQSVRVDGAGGYCNHVFLRTTKILSVGNVIYARFFVRFAQALGNDHVTFGAMSDAGDGGKNLRLSGQSGIFIFNRELNDATLPELSPTGIGLSVSPAVGKWTCVEIAVDEANSTLQTWVDGSDVSGLKIDHTPTPDVDAQWLRGAPWVPRLQDFKLGWESYGGASNTLWFDDVALGSQRIGCGSP